MPVSDDTWKIIAEDTNKNEILHQLKTNIISGSIVHCSHYYNFLQELSIVDGVIIKSNRVVVPTSLRGRMLQIIYERHMGIAKCRSRTCQALYWHKMNEEINNCDTVNCINTNSEKNHCIWNNMDKNKNRSIYSQWSSLSICS